MKILLTGATGFIGSNVGAALAGVGHQLICLKRSTSSLRRCQEYERDVVWLDSDLPGWQSKVTSLQPEAIVHCGWAGVTSAERDDWVVQAKNVDVFVDLLKIAADSGTNRFIALGSQAEYGTFNGRIDESFPTRPNSAYGAAKLACLTFLETFARQSNVSYAWLRIFSVYGPGEGGQWLIPSLVRQFQEGKAPKLTGCEQRYDYLHVSDLAEAILAALGKIECSGIYNVGSNSSVPLREVVEKVQQFTGSSVPAVFGALPYRPNQSMHMEGDSSRFYRAFGFAPRIPLNEGFRQLVDFTSQ